MLSGKRFMRRYAVFFILYAVCIGLYLWYTSPNTVPEAYRGTPADPATFMTAEQLKQSEVLSALSSGLFFIGVPWNWALYLLLLTSGLAAKWRERLERTSLPAVIRFVLFVAAVSLFTNVLYLPLRFTGYMMLRSYGISIQPFWSWLRDKGIDFAVGMLTMLIVTAVALPIIRRGGRWWLKLWLLSVPFILFMMYIQPTVIDPLYNKFTRLSDPQLEQSILKLAAKADIPVDRVYEVHVSNKTNALNAYVNGIGGNLRIVLWDTTLKRLNEKEILQIMAHEMGHFVMHHLEWSAFGAVASSFFLLWIGGGLYIYIVKRKGRNWGIHSPYDVAALPLMLLVISVLSFAASPFSNAVSRHAEKAADDYAMQLIGSAEGAVTMQQKLSIVTLDDVNPPLLVEWFISDHPNDMERILDALHYRPQ